MRDLLDRLGCFLQLGIGFATFLALSNWTTLPGWGAALLAFGASYVGMWLLVAIVGVLLGE